MKKLIAPLAGLMIGVAATSASAFTWTNGGIDTPGNNGLFSSQALAVTITFDSGSAPTGSPVNYAGGGVVLGNPSTHAALPADDTYFFSVGPSTSNPATITFASKLSYFGFNWGSPDTYNSVQLYNGNTLLGSFTGSVLANAMLVAPNGNQTVGGYLNVTADNANEYFDKILFISGTNAFESDNHAYITAVPEPDTYAMILAGLGMVGFIARRRTRNLSSFA